jgi:hypothetical protein
MIVTLLMVGGILAAVVIGYVGVCRLSRQVLSALCHIDGVEAPPRRNLTRRNVCNPSGHRNTSFIGSTSRGRQGKRATTAEREDALPLISQPYPRGGIPYHEKESR